MIRAIHLFNDSELEQLWFLQHTAYRIEAERAGFQHVPPILETMSQLQSSEQNYIGFFHEECLWGALSYVIDDTSLTICRLMVDPEHFRQGIAFQLIEHIIETSHQIQEFIVYTGAKNTAAVQLYQKHGFHPVGDVEAASGIVLTEFKRIKD